MCDNLLIIESLRRIADSLDEIADWTGNVDSDDEFTSSAEGMILLNAVCMKLLTVGEEVKALDRKTGGELLSRYGSIPWREVMGLRDIIAHHYFDVDAGEIFSVVKHDLPPLAEVVRRMIKDLVK
ncbi:MAG: DUF86 domain-containing protein [Alistipes sp.]|jgi:uncharacterized protein with HEPN domain|nr:DUF86 domain-containing protein [Alistipes sp.]